MLVRNHHVGPTQTKHHQSKLVGTQILIFPEHQNHKTCDECQQGREKMLFFSKAHHVCRHPRF